MKFLSSGSSLPIDTIQTGCRVLSQSAGFSPRVRVRCMAKSFCLLGKREYHNKIHNHFYESALLVGSANRLATSTTSLRSPFGSRAFATQDDASHVVLIPLTSKESQLLTEASVEARRISAIARNSSSPLNTKDSPVVVDRPQVLKCFAAASTLMSLTEAQKTFADVILRQNSATKEQVCSLHWAFLSVISWCISLAPQNNALVLRALDLACRADELGLPLHLPLYQDLMRAIAEYSSDKGIVYSIFKISKMITPALGVPVEGDFFSGAAVALIRRRKVAETIDLLMKMNVTHDVSFIGYEGTQEIFTFLLTQFGDPSDAFEKERVHVLASLLHKALYHHAREDGNNLSTYVRNMTSLALVANLAPTGSLQAGIARHLFQSFPSRDFSLDEEESDEDELTHIELVDSDSDDDDADRGVEDDNSVPKEISFPVSKSAHLRKDVAVAKAKEIERIIPELLKLESFLQALGSPKDGEADTEDSDEYEDDNNENDEDDDVNHPWKSKLVSLLVTAATKPNDDTDSFEDYEENIRSRLYSRDPVPVPDILDQLGIWGVNTRFTSQFEDLLIEREMEFDSEDFDDDLDDDDYDDEYDGLGDDDDDNDNHDD